MTGALVESSASELARALVGPHFGLLEDLERVQPEADDLPVTVYAGRLASTTAFSPIEVPRLVSGASLEPGQAMAACLGEGVERYCGGLPAPGAIVRSRARELGARAITPDRFALFSSRQYRAAPSRFPFVRWSPDDRIGWVEARSLASNDVAFLPAAFVYQPYAWEPGEPVLAPSLSTGLACAWSLEDAAAAGLFEVIERDAVALAWMGKVIPPRLDFGAVELGRDAGNLAGLLTARGYAWAVLDLTTDLGVPVAAAWVEGHSPVGRIGSFGSACHPDRNRAVTKALVEAAHCRMYVKSMLREDPRWRAGRRFERVTSFAHHARFYSTHPEHRACFERWLHAPTASPAAPRALRLDSVGQIARRLEASGLEPFFVDVSTPEVATIGLHVARVIVPGLQPLHGHHAWQHLGGPRLRRLREVFGPRTREPRRWNRYPHPCP